MKSLILLAWAAWAAPVDLYGDRIRKDTTLLGPMPTHWLKMYSLSPYKETWNLMIEVKDLDKDLPRLLEHFERSQASLTVPLANSLASPSDRSRQLSYRLPLKTAKNTLKQLRKIGKFGEPAVRPAYDPVPIEEVKEKIAKLVADKKTNAQALAAMPGVSAVIDELLEHLFLVEYLRERAAAEVLLNMTVRERPK